MGMDIYGKENDAYFRRTIFSWPQLGTFLVGTFPDLTAPCKLWFTNDGDGLNKRQSLELSRAIGEALAAGEVEKYVKALDAELDAIPDETCEWCKGTGIRDDEVGRSAGFPKKVVDDPNNPRFGQLGWCNGCSGSGMVTPYRKNMRLEVSDVEEFCAFLQICGGFEIW